MAAAIRPTTITMSTSSAMLLVGILPKCRVSGDSATAITSSTIDCAMLPTLVSSPPDATADARSTPCFWRNRICAAMPPTAGTARFENDIDSCSSAVRTSGSGIGTVPISATAVAKLVRNEMNVATTSRNQSAFLIVS